MTPKQYRPSEDEAQTRKEIKMVYSNKLIMCVLFNGSPQKELANGVVKLPFGAEYSLRFRNKNSRRAVVQIYIDGENVSGGGYVVPAQGHIDIKRHHDLDRAFKFVSLDSEEAVEHGKNGPNEDKVKGTIEARFFLEKEQPKWVLNQPYIQELYPTPRNNPNYWDDIRYLAAPPAQPAAPQPGLMDWRVTCDSDSKSISGAMGASATNQSMGQTKSGGGVSPSTRHNQSILRSRRITSQNVCLPAGCEQKSMLQDGCTVEGAVTGQNFRKISIDTEDVYTSLKIFLQGSNELVERPKQVNEPELTLLELENKLLREQIAALEAERLRRLENEQLSENERLKQRLQELQEQTKVQ